MSASAGRKGRPWRRTRAYVLGTSDLCHLCLHHGAGEVDHDPIPLVELVRLGLDPNDPEHCKPAHGSSSPCPTCGKHCNQLKGARQAVTHSRDW